MSNIFDAIDKYRYGIIAAFAVAVGIFMYLELTYVEQYFEIESSFDKPTVEIVKEELLITPENLQIQPPPQFEAGKVTNTARDMNDTRQRSDEDWSASKSASDVEKSVRDEERKMFDETGGEAKRKAIREEDEQRKKNVKESIKDNGKVKGNNPPGDSSPNAVKGNVMVEWSLSNRNPHLNNEWYVRNPGYTCGYGSSGRVAISIKVGQDGKVISAVQDISGSSSASACMIEQALKYAKLSRFDYSGSAPEAQSGKIYYTFVSQ